MFDLNVSPIVFSAPMEDLTLKPYTQLSPVSADKDNTTRNRTFEVGVDKIH